MEQLEQTIDLLARLVSIPSTPGRANAEIADFILQAAAPPGTRALRVPSPAGDGDGLILSAGPDLPGGLILSGHLDVVSAEGQGWPSDPFRLRRQGGRLHGRGTCDMKGFVACALTQLAQVARSGTARPPHVVLSADEESACRSIESLVDAVQTRLPPARGVLGGEPTEMRPADRHKASATHHVEVTGRAMHASMAHRGTDAIALAARLIAWLGDETRAAAARPGGQGFDPGHALHTATRIRGGIAVNTVAEHCSFDWDMRLMPGDRMEDAAARFDQFAQNLCANAPGAQVSRSCTAWFPGLAPSPSSRFGAELLTASRAAAFDAMPFGTEAGFFQAAGLDTFVCGPGSAEQAHVADEYVPAEDLAACLSLLNSLTAW
jgi:acetylornithine deacetylase